MNKAIFDSQIFISRLEISTHGHWFRGRIDFGFFRCLFSLLKRIGSLKIDIRWP